MQQPLIRPQHDVTGREDALAPDVAFAVRMADWLDDRYIDPIVGFLLPGAGDLLFAAVGIYPIFVALRRRMPPIVAARMIRNLAIDLLFGAVPVIGDVFDWVFKAHRRNANLLLERHVLGPAPWRDWTAVLAAVLLLVIALSVPIALVALALARFG
jgi:hypothetical protein